MCMHIQIIHVCLSAFNKIESDLWFDNGVLTEKYLERRSDQNDCVRFHNKDLDLSVVFIRVFIFFESEIYYTNITHFLPTFIYKNC